MMKVFLNRSRLDLESTTQGLVANRGRDLEQAREVSALRKQSANL